MNPYKPAAANDGSDAWVARRVALVAAATSIHDLITRGSAGGFTFGPKPWTWALGLWYFDAATDLLTLAPAVLVFSRVQLAVRLLLPWAWLQGISYILWSGWEWGERMGDPLLTWKFHSAAVQLASCMYANIDRIWLPLLIWLLLRKLCCHLSDRQTSGFEPILEVT